MKSKSFFRQSARSIWLKLVMKLADLWYWLHLQRRCIWCRKHCGGNPFAALRLPCVCDDCMAQRVAGLKAGELPFD